MIKVKQLSYSIGNQAILEQVSLHVKAGQYCALAGENGAGKSTLFKVILDLIRNISSGSVEIAGSDNRAYSSRNILSYLPEKFDFTRDVSGWQYLEMIAGVYRSPLNRDRVGLLCQQLGLDEARLSSRSDSYSKGMKQKLGLVSCFMLDTPLILLDEPLTGLDPGSRYRFKRLLQQERSKKRSILYSTHMLADAEEICDRFLILHQGRIAFEGAPEDCKSRYNATSLEQAYMRCISGDAAHDEAQLSSG